MGVAGSKIIRTLGIFLGGLVITGFALRVIYVTWTGESEPTYSGGRGLMVHYSSMAVLLVVVGAALVFVGAHRLWTWYRDR
jgi:hypothetical protein